MAEEKLLPVHYSHGSRVLMTLCGLKYTYQVTNHIPSVTCKDCLAKIVHLKDEELE